MGNSRHGIITSLAKSFVGSRSEPFASDVGDTLPSSTSVLRGRSARVVEGEDAVGTGLMLSMTDEQLAQSYQVRGLDLQGAERSLMSSRRRL